MKVPEGFRTIYCFKYGDFTGGVLRSHYTTEEKIKELLDLGSLYWIGYDIGTDIQTIDDPLPRYCLAYGRDLNMPFMDAKVYETFEDWINCPSKAICEYAYLWNGESWEQHMLKEK
jgi:hypothetical protein